MTIEMITLGVVVTTALVMIGLERLFPYDKGQRLFRRGFWLDLLPYGILQSLVLGFVINGFIRWIDQSSGLSRWDGIRSWPILAQVAFFVVTHDLYIYLFHRLQHYNPYLWRIHEAHHSVKEVDWVAGSRSHSLEIMINQTIEFAPIVLFGSPEVAAIKGAVSSIWGMWIHSNINARTGWLQYFINGPEMHRWHHAADLPWPGRNFSTKLAIWDWLFGTAYLPKEKPKSYGLGDVEFPDGYFSQHLAAFRPFDDQPSSTSDSTSKPASTSVPS